MTAPDLQRFAARVITAPDDRAAVPAILEEAEAAGFTAAAVLEVTARTARAALRRAGVEYLLTGLES